MKVQFNGPEAECEVFGRVFPVGEAVDVSDLPEGAQKKLAGNPTFTVAKTRQAAPKASEAQA